MYLVRSHLEAKGIEVLDFNPWMFSGTSQLIERFFFELASQMRLRRDIAEVGKELEQYGEVLAGLGWIPVLGPWLERARVVLRFGSRIAPRKNGGVTHVRDKVVRELAKLEKPIVVALDDIDRLTGEEIRSIFKLVRLSASFPNVIYLLAFDRTRVERALAEDQVPGREYLEKILQLGVDLPAAPAAVIHKQILEATESALSSVRQPGPLDKEVWANVFAEVVRPLIGTMRDVRRYVSAVGLTVRDLEGQVALADVLGLEAVRVFLPSVFYRLQACLGALTRNSDEEYASEGSVERAKEQVEGLVKLGGEQSEVVRAFICQLFPEGGKHLGSYSYGSSFGMTWLRERRVAHEDIFRLYLERVPGESLRTFSATEHAWTCIADHEAFDDCLRSIEIEQVEDVIAGLETFQEEFTLEVVRPGALVLLNLLPELPERSRGMFDLGAPTRCLPNCIPPSAFGGRSGCS